MSRAEPIAVIGLACRLPGADSAEAFWALMQQGGCATGPVPASRWRWDPQAGFPPQAMAARLQRGGFLEGLEDFDAGFFHLADDEARRLDPQQKLALELAWQALESACIVPATLVGSDTAVIMGVGHADHAHKLRNDHASYDGKLGPSGYEGFAAHRVSHCLGFKGPSYSVNAACSSSLHAIHLGCQALQCGDSALVLAGGVNVHLAVDESVSCALAGWLAADGRCKSFREGADGYVRSEGGGVAVLKRLEDALRDGDPVWGVISASALAHNGTTMGIALPSRRGQRELLGRLLVRSGLAPADIQVLEAHGIGSAMSDRIEIGAITDVLAEGRTPEEPLQVGCCKPQVGHLEAAAGVAGLAKLLLCLRHQALPALDGSGPLNPEIRGHPGVQLLTEPCRWPARPGRPRRAVLANYSFGGANAGLVVQEPPQAPRPAADQLSGPRLLALRARTAGGLLALRASLCRHLDDTGEPLSDDHLQALNLHRSEFRQYRSGYVAADLALLEAALRQGEPCALAAAPSPAAQPAVERPAGDAPDAALPQPAHPLGLGWAGPDAELRRWYVTARLLDHWQAQGHRLPAAPGQPAQAEALAQFWRHAGAQLGLAPPPGLVASATADAAHDWRLALARELMVRYCAGEPLQWHWLATGRRVSVATHPFDRQPSWFEPVAQAEPAAQAS